MQTTVNMAHDHVQLVAGNFCQISAATQGFGPLVASQLSAQAHITAWSGSGLTGNAQTNTALAARLSAGVAPPALPFYYSRSDGAQAYSSYDFSLYKPQVRGLSCCPSGHTAF